MNRAMCARAVLALVGSGWGCAEEEPPFDYHGGGGDPVGGDADHGGDAGTASNRGLVYAMSGSFYTVHTSGLQATFGPDRNHDPSCTVADQGGCAKTVCNYPSGVRPTAGTITVTGALQSPLTLAADGNGAYSSNINSAAALFDGGEDVTFAAAGAEVAGFTESVTAPAAVTVTAPAFSAGQVTVDTAVDLPVAWSGAAAGEVLLVAGGNISATNTTIIMYCRFGAAGGSGSVPAALLSGFSAIDQSPVLAVGLAGAEEVALADWAVTVLLHRFGSASLGPAASSTVDYQ